MQLKRLPVRLRRRRLGPRRRAREVSPAEPPPAPPRGPRPLCTSAGSRPTAVAPGSVLRYRGRWPCARARGAYSPGARQSGSATEETLVRCFALATRAPRRDSGGLGRSRRVGGRGCHCLSVAVYAAVVPGGRPVAPRVEVVGVRMAASDPS